MFVPDTALIIFCVLLFLLHNSFFEKLAVFIVFLYLLTQFWNKLFQSVEPDFGRDVPPQLKTHDSMVIVVVVYINAMVMLHVEIFGAEIDSKQCDGYVAYALCTTYCAVPMKAKQDMSVRSITADK